jgi:ribosomal-protein-alanine N-acetyltransferase
VSLRPLVAGDFLMWREVRRANAEWLGPWEPARLPGQPDVVEDPQSFSVRCDARQREFQLGTAFGFGIFVGEQLVGEINLSSVQRGAFRAKPSGAICRATVCSAPSRAGTSPRTRHNNF